MNQIHTPAPTDAETLGSVAPQRGGFFARFRARGARGTRAHERYQCRVPALINLMTADVAMKGYLLDMSERGCLFRPGLHYLMQRSAVDVQIVVGGIEIDGFIVNTTPMGYGINFHKRLLPSRLKLVLAHSEK